MQKISPSAFSHNHRDLFIVKIIKIYLLCLLCHNKSADSFRPLNNCGCDPSLDSWYFVLLLSQSYSITLLLLTRCRIAGSFFNYRILLSANCGVWWKKVAKENPFFWIKVKLMKQVYYLGIVALLHILFSFILHSALSHCAFRRRKKVTICEFYLPN